MSKVKSTIKNVLSFFTKGSSQDQLPASGDGLSPGQDVDAFPLSTNLAAKLSEIEASIDAAATRAGVLEKLRVLGIDDFGYFLLTIPNSKYPLLSKHLPAMAADQVQKNWTGSSGVHLLNQTITFVKSVAQNYAEITGESLQQKDILDFGCGYGRIARLMYYYSNEDSIFGVDPWDESIKICNNDGLVNNYFLSDWLPKDLPLGEKKFDLIYAFSVFSHLSERTAITCLNVLADYIKDDGVIVITIRPIEYWDHDIGAIEAGLIEKQKSDHINIGYSFLPHHREPVDGEVTYGDSSMTLEWIAQKFKNLEVLTTDQSATDPYQILVYLRKVK